jgi:hypothetical protein
MRRLTPYGWRYLITALTALVFLVLAFDWGMK